ncbi:MAG: UDP-N-acetylglucosamine 4,6-dehydratase (inverting) [Cytophagales bacterium]|nr:UDP-N-acetylglucosamine 4,6-dehydratase (inverting) [Cytophagales bacterium]
MSQTNLNLNGKSLLVTGGTGSFGKKFVETILKRYPKVKRLVIFSRDELKQFEMAQVFPHSKYKAIRYFIGDIRDRERLLSAFDDIEIVIHAAALKQVPTAEYNPMEYIKTNVFGAENIINASIKCGVNNVVALSTDKAAAPINLYGATKLCSDKLFVAANNVSGKHDIKYSVVRYGNVMGSRGSVIPFFLNKRHEGILPVTSKDMTRFNISLEESVDLVLFAIAHAQGGEIFVPKIPSYKITDLAAAIGPDCEHKIVGIRPGEKIHEEMITTSDALSTVDIGKYYVILPQSSKVNIKHYIDKYKAKKVPAGFSYNSGNNTEWLSVKQIRGLIKKNIDPEFTV